MALLILKAHLANLVLYIELPILHLLDLIVALPYLLLLNLNFPLHLFVGNMQNLVLASGLLELIVK